MQWTHRARRAALAVALLLAVLLGAAPGQAAGETPRLQGVVNINTATPDQLQLLPGIGEARARAVVAARKERGGFKSVEDLMDVKGIGETALSRMRPFVALSGKTTAQIE